MHGRLKVKTTAEQQEAKRKEREKKLKLYTAGTEKVFDKKRKGEYDNEGLAVSGELLAANPDFYTLWNFRRETFEKFKESKTDEEMKELYDNELSFLEGCLRVNPKSYGTWHHRCWVMDNTPSPDWNHELKLCNKCLELDERNFHCWDYRRFVVKRAEVPLEKEFTFTTDKISSNFSNFSSWHYRSKLLPKLHPDASHPVGIKEKVLFEEYELTQNAFFTDPNDQSAWFYYRWLLGRGEKPFNIRLLYVTRARQRPTVVVSLTKTVQVGKDCQLRLVVDSERVRDVSWFTPSKSQHSNVWCCDIDIDRQEHNIQVILRSANGDKAIDNWSCVLGKDKEEAKHTSNFKPGMLFGSDLSACATTTLKEQLDQCQQLHELEPENKWAMLTILALARALDPIKHAEETFTYLDKLKVVDPTRVNYYNDLRSKYVMENAIEANHKGGIRELQLSGRHLTALYHLDHIVITKNLDLSNNQISSLRGCEVLQCIQMLNMDGNKVSSCDGLQGLETLQELSLRNNVISDVSALSPLTLCKNLRTLRLDGNPITENTDFKEQVQQVLPQVVSFS